MTREFKFKDQEVVTYTLGQISGVGKVLGYATVELPVIGAMVIIEDLSKNVLPSEDYPFRVFTCPEIHVYKAD